MATFERRNLEINEISACKKGANPGAKIFLFKADNEENKMLDVEKIEDAELKKEVESFIKEQEDKAEKLQEQVDALQEAHDELKELEKKGEPIDKKVEKLPEDMQKAWNDAQEQMKKAEESAASAVAEVAKMKTDSLRKDVSDSVDKLPRITGSEDERKQFVEMAMKMDEKDRKVYLDTLAKVEKVAGENESLFKEIGNSHAPAGAAEDKIDALAREAVAKGDYKTIEIARATLREINPDLRKQERDEINSRKG